LAALVAVAGADRPADQLPYHPDRPAADGMTVAIVSRSKMEM
jgi:hypothetical protein